MSDSTNTRDPVDDAKIRLCWMSNPRDREVFMRLIDEAERLRKELDGARVHLSNAMARRDLLADREKEIVVRWIIDNVDSSVVPLDEGNGDALIYNLVGLARHGPGYRPWDYADDQQREVDSWLAGAVADPPCPLGHTPNATTRAAIAEGEAGRGTRWAGVRELFVGLGVVDIDGETA